MIKKNYCVYVMWWFCGERNQKSTEPKFSIQSIVGFTVNKTDKRLKKFYRWFFGDFD